MSCSSPSEGAGSLVGVAACEVHNLNGLKVPVAARQDRRTALHNDLHAKRRWGGSEPRPSPSSGKLPHIGCFNQAISHAEPHIRW